MMIYVGRLYLQMKFLLIFFQKKARNNTAFSFYLSHERDNEIKSVF